MEMHEIKGTCLLEYVLEQHNMVRELIHALFVQAQ
jgi:hypothetical protein